MSWAEYQRHCRLSFRLRMKYGRWPTVDQVVAQEPTESLREDAARYRFIRDLGWYVDAAAQVFEIGYDETPPIWRNPHRSVDWDEVEEEIDKARRGE